MKREIVNFVQGSDAWHAHRDGSYNASESPSMLNINGAHTSRSELIRQVATGIRPEVDAHTQKRFDEGHRAEALARPLAEEIIGDDLFPSTMTLEVEGLKRKLSASLDGRTMDDATTWEHKLLNNALAASLSIGIIPEKYHPQMEQGLMITGAKRCLFMASAWDDYENLIEEKHVWYESNPELRAKLIPGWKQFEEDVENYQHVEVLPPPVADAIAELPALSVEIFGEVRRSNLVAFRAKALDYIESINTDLQTDTDFANAEKTVKFCADSEKKLDLVKQQALSQTATIDELFRTIDLLKEQMRSKRLQLEKAVKARKEAIRDHLVMDGKKAFAEHINKLNARIGRDFMPAIAVDFAGAIKGKKTVAGLTDAVLGELARAKIAASEIADRVEFNVRSLTGEGHSWEFLFPDLKAVCVKEYDDFASLLAARVAAHKEAEAKRLEAERERIRKEELARIEREQIAERERIAAETRIVEAEAAKVEADRARIKQEEAAREEAARALAEASSKTIFPGGGSVTSGTANTPVAAPAAIAPDSFAADQDRKAAHVLDEIVSELVDMTLDELKLVAHAIERIKQHRRVAA